MGHFFVVLDAGERVVPIAVVDLATPACGAVVGVINQEAEFPEEGKFNVPILETVVWGAPTYTH